jgi:TolB-like protein/DNA-binding winged helix-turn-helix (wHTH) protein/Tfp pilus assembly protein PilF
LTDKAFETLCVLVRHAGRLVTKDDIMGVVWPESIVEENNLDQQISTLRRALGDRGKTEGQHIETVRGRGYRFSKEVRTIRSETLALSDRVSIEDRPDRAIPRAGRAWKLRTIYLLVPIMTAVGVFGYFFLPGGDSDKEVELRRSLAVLPFANLGDDPKFEFLSDGIAETLINNLSHVKGLRVMSRHSAFRFRDNQSDTHSIASRLGVETLVTGDVRHVGDKVVVNVRLIEPSDGSQVWGNQYVKSSGDILALQNELAQAVSEHLKVQLSSSEKLGLLRNYTNNPEAYQLYLQGRSHSYKITEKELHRSIELFQRAIDLDPNYALAYAAVADSYRILATAGWNVRSKDAFPHAKAAAMKALEIDPDLAEAHIMLGWVAYNYDWEWDRAEAAFKKAIGLAPNSAEAQRAYSHFLSSMARHDEAVAVIRRGRELDPLSPIINTLEGQFLHYSGQDDQAATRLRQTLDTESNFWVAHNALARVQIRQGDYSAAIESLNKATEVSGGNTIEPLMQLGYTFAVSGDQQKALATMAQLRSLAEERVVPAYSFAMIYNGLGEHEAALEYLERSVREREVQLAFLKIDPRWDNLRSEPKFVGLMSRMKL